MANKREKQKRAEENAKKVYIGEIKKLFKYIYIGLGLIAFSFVLCFCSWIYVDNSKSGVEVSASGWSFFCAFLSGKYSSTDKIFGDIAVPFYYYAKEYCEKIGLFTFLSILFGVLSAILSGAFLKISAQKIKAAGAISAGVCSAVSAVGFICSFVIALTAKNSDVLPVYCGGNPACSIKSLAVLSALVMIFAAVFIWYTVAKLIKINRRFA
ncbi:MAG: hypothetical protein SOX77_02140 [Candidatus Borkfalkiaceae bacterium]|nr:hypothetical protein [Christensenellaceae bacterium]